MNAKSSRRVPTRFGRDIHFELTPQLGPFAPDAARSQFEALKTRLMQRVLQSATDAALRHQLHLAANEAAAVAWTTPFPLLVLPMLLEEKTAEVHDYTLRQEQVRLDTPHYASDEA